MAPAAPAPTAPTSPAPPFAPAVIACAWQRVKACLKSERGSHYTRTRPQQRGACAQAQSDGYTTVVCVRRHSATR
eukprot:3057160-Prymnesium_polylepis.1